MPSHLHLNFMFEEMNTMCSQILFMFLENKMDHKSIHIP